MLIYILNITNCILFIVIIALYLKYNKIEHFDNEKIISKNIHQIWIGPKKKPDIFLNTWKVDYLNKFNDWNYTLWNDEKVDDLFKKDYKDFDINILKNIYYNENEYYCKADIARLLILYNYGGIYIDADSVWINNKNFEDIINLSKYTGMFGAYEPNKDHLANGVIGCTKKNKNILYLIMELIKMKDTYSSIRKKNHCWKVTGPLLFNKINKNITKLDSKFFYPVGWHGISDVNLHKKIKLPQESYMFQYGLSTNNLKY